MNGFNTFRRLFLPGALALAAFAQSAYALDPARAINQYARRAWNASNGFPRGRPDAISQSREGYLWIGTERGLIRFDGETFGRVEDFGPGRLALDHVLGVRLEKNGVSWIRSLSPSLIRYERGKFAAARVYAEHDSLVTAMASARDGSMLFASKMDGLFKSNSSSFQSLVKRELLPYSPATAIAETPDRDIWVGTADAGLVRVRGKTVVPLRELPSQRVTCLLAGPDEQVYVGTDHGLVLWNGTYLTNAGIPEILRTLPIWAILRDRDANIWIGSERGLIRLNSRGAVALESGDSAEPVTALFEDREGDLWAGSADQLMRIQESPFAIYHSAVSVDPDQGGPVHADSRGGIWTAPERGLLGRIDNSVVTGLSLPPPFDDRIYSIAGDEDDMWIGFQQHGVAHVAVHKGRFTALYPKTQGAPPRPVSVVHRNRDGTVWIGTVGGGVARVQNGQTTTYTTHDGLPSNAVFSISEGAGGTMWFGTPSGLSTLSENHWQTLQAIDGLPSANIYSTFVDKAGVVWAGTLGGLAFVRSGRAIATPSDLASPLRGAIFGITEDHLGSLWLVTSDAVFRADRARLLAGSLSSGDIREFGLSDGLLDTQAVRRDSNITLV